MKKMLTFRPMNLFGFSALLLTLLFSLSSQKASASVSFSGGHRQTTQVCQGATLNLSALLSVIDGSIGETVTWNIVTGPTLGTSTLSGFPTAITSTGSTLSSSSLTFSGAVYTTTLVVTDSFRIVTSNGSSTDSTEIIVTINPLPVDYFTATVQHECIGGTAAYHDTSTLTLTWNALPPSIATVSSSGVVTGLAVGTADIVLEIQNPATTCETVLTLFDTVLGPPVVPAPSGPSSVCGSASITLTDAMSGGTWSLGSVGAGIATVNASGVVTGLAAGTAEIVYSVTNSCGTGSDSVSITVSSSALAHVGGPDSVCVGSVINLSDATAGGGWASTVTGVATVDASGHVHGVSAGTTTIIYSVTGGCGTQTTDTVVTVLSNTLPAISGATSACFGTTTFLSDSYAGGTWSSSATSVATVNPATGEVFATIAGTTTITYTIVNPCGTLTTTMTFTVSGTPTAPPAITGTTTVCTGSTFTLTDGTTGGTWSSDAPTTKASINSSTGDVTVVDTHADTCLITYTVSNACGTTSTSTVLTIIAPPSAPATPSGPSAACTGACITLTDATAGGTWSCSNVAIATISASGTTVTVCGASDGTANISYTVTNFCGSTSSDVTITVSSPPTTPASISGLPAVCSGACVTLTDATTGGTWSSSNAALATVTGAGTSATVCGASAGSPNISYTITNTCGSASAVLGFTVNALPTVAAITGAGPICVGSAITVSDATSGGTWSTSTPSIITVSSSGVVTGLSAGSGIVDYAITNSCGTTTQTATVVVTASPTTPAAISGPAVVCVGANITLTETSGGGTWSSSNAADAPVSAAGVVHGNAVGTASISYTVTNSCGTAFATYAVSVLNTPATPAVISGPGSVCLGSTITLTDATSGGTWSSSVTSVATIDGSGVVHPVATGATVIVYTETNACGTSTRNTTVLVQTTPSAPPAIGGPATVCTGATITETDVTSGGTWGVTNGLATINSSGVFDAGGTAGIDTVTYTVSNGCGSSTPTTRAITITGVPVVSAISGADTVCLGSTTNLTDGGGGTWSSTNAGVAGVVATTGVVTGNAVGSCTIRYTVTNSCGSTVVTQPMTVISTPATPAGIGGPATVCVGATITLTDATSAGTWSSTVTADATIDASTGTVLGRAVGATTISYSVSNICGISAATKVVSITGAPTVAGVTGASTMCVGTTTSLTDATAGGTWTSSDTSIAHVSAGGVVTSSPTNTGTVIISYTVTNSCGSTTSTRAVAVTTGPVTPEPIGGTRVVCVGSCVTLTDATAGGTFSTVDPAIATCSAGGLVCGVLSGTAIISYTVTNSCGTSAALDTITVNDVPASPAAITGFDSVCLGGTTLYADTDTPGVWNTSSSIFAGVSGTGVVSGVTLGTATISYQLSNSCGLSAPATRIVHIVTVPTVPAIGGATVVCRGATTVLTDAASGGAWSSVSTAVDTISATGVVYGLAVGTTTISYTLTNFCGSNAFERSMTVNDVPATPAPIVGSTTICEGTTETVTDDTTGGIWSSSNTSVAIISGGGTITAGTSDTGTSIISYTVTNACGPTAVSIDLHVITSPVVAPITGTTHECVGSSTVLSDATAGGSWFSLSTSVATVSGSTVYGASAGTTFILYSVTNMCGTNEQFVSDTVSPSVIPAISGTRDICTGSTATFSDTYAGGTWSSSYFPTATVGASSGVVTGVAVGTTVISYTVTNACGTISDTFAVAVSSSVVTPIIGSSSVCVGANTTLVDTTSFGTWSSLTPSVATINAATGQVGGVAAGTSIIEYSVTNACGGPFIQTLTETVNPLAVPGTISGPTVVCMASSIALSDAGASSAGSWSSSNTSIATVDVSGNVWGVTAGTVTITYTVTNGCGPEYATYSVTVNPLPISGTIVGLPSVCQGSSITLTDGTSAPAGTWQVSNASIATISTFGVLSGLLAGDDTAYYIVTNSCGTDSASALVTVNPTPVVSAITGTTTVCQLSSTTLADGTSGGSWSSSNSTIATIDPASGIVTGLLGGTVTISYSVTNVFGCNTTVTTSYTVNPLPVATSIGGTPVVCAGSTTSLTDGVAGGTWITFNPYIATVDGSGTVYGVSIGTTVITYEVTNICGTADTTITVTVNPLPDAGVLSGTTAVCMGTTGSITTTSGSAGTWSSSNTSIATVDGSGNIYPNDTGNVFIHFVVTNSCGTSDSSILVTILPLPYAGVISPSDTEVCAGVIVNYTSTVPGGFWVSSDAGVATIDLFSGVATTVYTPGDNEGLILYSVTTSCGTVLASPATIFVDPIPFVIAITGSDTVCQGGVTYLADSVTGGTWTSSNLSIATVDPTSGAVYGVSGGIVNITYTVSSALCGSADTFVAVTVIPQPNAGSISGSATVCVGITDPLTESVTGGTWSSSSTSIATVDTTGVVTGVAAGFVDITYTVTNYCNTSYTTFTIAVNPQPFAGPVTGPRDSVCVGSTLDLSDAVSGGTWSSRNMSLATVDASGIVYGVLAGTDVISYTITNSCGHADSTMTVYVMPLPLSGTVSGSATVCQGSSTTYTSTDTGGVWSSTTVAVATVVDTTGVIHGVTAGTSVISYSVTNYCGTAVSTKMITVNPLPDSGVISGPIHVCVGNTITLTDGSGGTTGGVWHSTVTSVATVGLSTGIVGGVAAGTTVISYIATTVCGSDSTGYTITVDPLPNAGAITGTDSLCVGGNTNLSDATGMTGGMWVSVTPSVATVDGTGHVVGISGSPAGTPDTIRYVVSTPHCGADSTYYIVYVHTVPNPGVITGSSPICVGTSHVFTESASGGTWSEVTSHASVTATGTVSGVSGGVDTIIYTVTNFCGTTHASDPIVVDSLPSAGSITGTFTLCAGTSTTLTDAAAGGTGTWSSSRSSVATISATGVVHAQNVSVVSTDTISYTVSSAFGCASAVATAVITVDPLPRSGTIYGSTTVCVGRSITLSDTTGVGGSWSVSPGTVAGIISTTGVLTGSLAGTATVSYTATTALCGADTSYYTVTVNPLPDAGTITGTTPICVGTSVAFTDTFGGGGGVWASGTPTIATVTSTGTVGGRTAGTDIISYMVTNSCGTDTARFTVVVNAAPIAGTITGIDSVCVLGSRTLVDATGTTGGTWESTTPTIATVSPTGIVTGLVTGYTTISYVVTSASCGSDSTGVTFHVLPLGDTATGIHGRDSVCAGSYDSLSMIATGGTWTSSNTTIATVDPTTGVVGGRSIGNVTITYTASSAFCGSLSCYFHIYVSPLPVAGTLAGPHAVCAGSTITITETGGTGTGVWTSGGFGVDSILSPGAGVDSGIAAGTDVITYTATTVCGSAMVTYALTVHPLPDAGVISGPTTVCQASSTTLSETVTGGTWTSSSSATATVSAAGVVHGVAAGSVYITYTVPSAFGCSSSSTWYLMTVNPLPVAGSISGPTSVCAGAMVNYTDPTGTPGGYWTTAGSSIGVIDTAGNFTGVSGGTVVITYTATTASCGDTSTYATITVHDSAIAGAITSSISEFCSGITVTMGATIGGGFWTGSAGVTVVGSSSGTSATVTGGSGGTAYVYYSITSPWGCGTAVDTFMVTIDPYPSVSAITGGVSYCSPTGTPAIAGTLMDATSGGIWSSFNPGIAAVDSAGDITPEAVGTDYIYYSVTNGCGTTTDSILVTVNLTPVAGTISGPSELCPGNVITYAIGSSTGGGYWHSSDTLVATVDSVSGTVIALSTGWTTLTYSITTATCGNSMDTFSVFVNASPVAGVITPSTGTVCVESSVVYADAAPGGVWTSSNTSIANVNTVGLVSGVAAGMDTIYYTVTNICGSNYAYATVTVNPLPVAGTVTGSSSLCIGTPATMTDPATGGVWSMTNGTASISAVGNVTGLPGITTSVNDTVLYSVTNSCGTAVAEKVVTINPTPNAGMITGATWHVCEGDSIILVDPTGLVGGYWTSSNTAYALVSSTSNDTATILGISPGITVISYTFTDYCGTATTTDTITVRATGHCEDGVAIQKMNNGDINVYPNPAVSMLHIDAPVKVNISVMSADGKIIAKQNDVTDIDVSSYANGLYMIMIYDENNALLKVAKFIKTN